MASPSNDRKALLLGLLAVLFWSTAASAFKLSLEVLEPFTLLFLSAAVSFLFLLARSLPAMAGRRGSGGSRGGARPLRFVARASVRGLLNPFLYYLVLFEAYDRLPAQVAMVINYLWPVVLVLLSVPLLGQRIRPGRLVAILVSFLGVVLLALGNASSFDGGVDLPAMALALASTVIWGLFWILNLRHPGDDSVKMAAGFSFALVYLVAYGLAAGERFLPSRAAFLAGPAWVGVFEMGLTYLLWLRALSLAGSTAKVGSLIYFTPFLSLVWIGISVGERITSATLAGLLLVVAGIASGAGMDRRAGSDQVQQHLPQRDLRER